MISKLHEFSGYYLEIDEQMSMGCGHLVRRFSKQASRGKDSGAGSGALPLRERITCIYTI